MAGNPINPVVIEIWPTLLLVCLSVQLAQCSFMI